MKFIDRVAVITQLGFREAALPQLEDYTKFLWEANEELNLFSRQLSFTELLDNHLIDCLLPLAHFPRDVHVVADFGAGGGLPGVLWALQFPELKVRLFEKSKLKQQFLNRCKQFAPNLEVLGEIPIQLGEVDLVTSRGFKPLDVTLSVSRDYFKRRGRYFLLKGRREKIEEEILLARRKFKDLSPRLTALHSPVLAVERHLVEL
jgi:16S rRNA (guanine527-N7)-methyltransferase